MKRLLLLVGLVGLTARLSAADDAAARPWVWWWWPGSAVAPAEITRELETLASNGIGGVTITPIYGALGSETNYLPFLSAPYLDALRHATAEAKRLGLQVDMPTGTGWPFGGPRVPLADAEQRLRITNGQIVSVPTGFRVKRAAPGGEGLVVNPYSSSALRRYLAGFDAALNSLPAGALRAQSHDSFEYNGNWADELPAAFVSQHGYDLRDHVAELGGQGDPDTVARVKGDYRATLASLHLDYIRSWTDWAHGHGERTINQAHGAPGNLLDLYAAADIPQTEIFGSGPFPLPGFRRDANEIAGDEPQPLINRFASSAAHVAGKPLASAETFTWLREHFHEAPSQMKPELDRLFLCGINHVFYHGTCYSPSDAPWPGWVFYASTQFNSRNPLWRDLGALTAYTARCQRLLREGFPDNDVLLYWPIHDVWHNAAGLEQKLTVHQPAWLNNSPCGRTAAALVALGCGFDYISDTQLEALLHPRQAVLIPRTDHIPESTLASLLRLASNGATVVFLETLPDDVPGLGRLEERRAAFRQMKQTLTFPPESAGQARSATVGSGRVWLVPDVTNALTASLARVEPAAAAGLGIVRRRTESGFSYFLANQGATPFDGWLPLGVTAASARVEDPLNGTQGLATLRQRNGSTEIRLQLPPGASLLLRTDDTATSSPLGAWKVDRVNGERLMLTGPWTVTFLEGGPALPSAREVTLPHDWSADEDPAARAFSGTARYRSDVVVPADAAATDWRLDLGDVRETARVRVNGTALGTCWSLPFELRVGSALRPGTNVVELDVTNLGANRLRDLDLRRVPWKIFRDANVVDIRYRPLDAARWKLCPSGLLSPVSLVPLKADD